MKKAVCYPLMIQFLLYPDAAGVHDHLNDAYRRAHSYNCTPDEVSIYHMRQEIRMSCLARLLNSHATPL